MIATRAIPDTLARSRASNRHKTAEALLLGVKPTGKRFEVLQTHWWKIKDGKIVFQQAVRDDLGMMRQRGLLPTEPPKN